MTHFQLAMLIFTTVKAKVKVLLTEVMNTDLINILVEVLFQVGPNFRKEDLLTSDDFLNHSNHKRGFLIDHVAIQLFIGSYRRAT